MTAGKLIALVLNATEGEDAEGLTIASGGVRFYMLGGGPITDLSDFGSAAVGLVRSESGGPTIVQYRQGDRAVQGWYDPDRFLSDARVYEAAGGRAAGPMIESVPSAAFLAGLEAAIIATGAVDRYLCLDCGLLCDPAVMTCEACCKADFDEAEAEAEFGRNE